MVDDAIITLNMLIILCSYIRDAFGKRGIFPEEEVHVLGEWHMEA